MFVRCFLFPLLQLLLNIIQALCIFKHSVYVDNMLFILIMQAYIIMLREDNLQTFNLQNFK